LLVSIEDFEIRGLDTPPQYQAVEKFIFRKNDNLGGKTQKLDFWNEKSINFIKILLKKRIFLGFFE
jgi:hypothetical protein